MKNVRTTLTLGTLLCLAVVRTSALAPQCTRNQEFFCQTESKFAWCEDPKFVETCPLNLLCNTNLEYLCVQRSLTKTSTTTTANHETTTIAISDDESWDNSTFSDYEDEIDDPWDTEASPPSSCIKAGRFPDSHDCNSYHICVPNISGHLKHIIVKCPGNSHYSTELGRCTLPEKARCHSEFNSFTCPNAGRVTHPKDCNSFMLCYPDGTWRRYYCPLHSFFDPHTLNCSFSKTVCQPLLNVFNCSQRGLYPDQFNCRKFYYCIPYQNKLIEGFAFCPKNSVYNPETSRCTKNFNACDRVEKFCNGKRPGRYPNMDNCSMFYVCTPGKARSISYSCPYGSHYNAQKQRCIFENLSTCGRAIQPCTEEGKFADMDTNCSGFYVCILKHHTWVKQHYKCPATSMFDINAKKCSTNTTCYEIPKKINIHKPQENLYL